jgi:hypothetical protein
MKKIVITFDKKGKSTVEAFGFSGGDCLKATKDIEDAIGKAEGRKMKSTGGGTVEAKQTVTQ